MEVKINGYLGIISLPDNLEFMGYERLGWLPVVKDYLCVVQGNKEFLGDLKDTPARIYHLPLDYTVICLPEAEFIGDPPLISVKEFNDKLGEVRKLVWKTKNFSKGWPVSLYKLAWIDEEYNIILLMINLSDKSIFLENKKSLMWMTSGNQFWEVINEEEWNENII